MTKETLTATVIEEKENLSWLRLHWAKYISPAIDGASSLLTVLAFFALIASLGASVALGEPLIVLLGIAAAVGTAFYQHHRNKQEIAQREHHEAMAADVCAAKDERASLKAELAALQEQVQRLNNLTAAHTQILDKPTPVVPPSESAQQASAAQEVLRANFQGLKRDTHGLKAEVVKLEAQVLGLTELYDAVLEALADSTQLDVTFITQQQGVLARLPLCVDAVSLSSEDLRAMSKAPSTQGSINTATH